MPQVNSFALFYGANYPAPADVRAGSPTYGDAINVLNGTLVVGGDEPVFPPENRVIAGEVYGTPDEFLGNFEFAPEEKVEAGHQYGSNGVEFTGTLVSDTDYPVEGDVRSGIAYNFGANTGNYEPADITQVVAGHTYGALGVEFVGQYVCELSFVIDTDMAIVIGDSYEGDRAFTWEDDGTWGDLTGWALTWELVADERYEILTLEPTYAAGVITLEIKSEDTAELVSRTYRYGLRGRSPSGEVRTFARGGVALSMPYADIPE